MVEMPELVLGDVGTQLRYCKRRDQSLTRTVEFTRPKSARTESATQ